MSKIQLRTATLHGSLKKETIILLILLLLDLEFIPDIGSFLVSVGMIIALRKEEKSRYRLIALGKLYLTVGSSKKSLKFSFQRIQFLMFTAF